MNLPASEIMLLEHIAARAWPAARERRIGDWRLFATSGFSNRINACWPLGDPGRLPATAIGEVETWYADHGLRPLFKLADGAVDPVLVETLGLRGYRARTETITMVAPLCPRDADPNIALNDALDATFRILFASGRAAHARDAKERLDTLARIPTPRAFACLSVENQAAAVGAVAVAGAWAGVAAMRTAPSQLRRGLARRVLRALTTFAATRGATTAYLQVEADNAPAIALYADEGFKEAYRYRYWDRPGGKFG